MPVPARMLVTALDVVNAVYWNVLSLKVIPPIELPTKLNPVAVISAVTVCILFVFTGVT